MFSINPTRRCPSIQNRGREERFLNHDFRLTGTKVFRQPGGGSGANRRAPERGGRLLRTPGAPCSFHRVSGKFHPTKPELRNSPADRKSTRLNSSHVAISYAVFCLKKKKR